MCKTISIKYESGFIALFLFFRPHGWYRSRQAVKEVVHESGSVPSSSLFRTENHSNWVSCDNVSGKVPVKRFVGKVSYVNKVNCLNSLGTVQTCQACQLSQARGERGNGHGHLANSCR